ncbi:hypothetical protein Taro_053525, partial [Colocasia esculenta]|nr:hypothetical protein [Colocasia esculenta]
RGDDCDLWKLTEFNLDSRFELDTQIHLKKNLARFGGPKLEILIQSASGLFQHGRSDECDLWKLTEFNSYSWFEHDAQIHIKQYGQGDDCDLWKLTEFNLESRFELDVQIHLKQVPSSSGVGGDEDEEHEDEDS